MGKLVQIKNRSGYYLRVSVPLSLRKIVGSASIEKKAGGTRIEAIRNKPKLELEIEAKFKEKLFS